MTTNLTLKDQMAEYWAARAPSFDASPGRGIRSRAEREAWLDLVAERLGPMRDRQVLELASGTSEFTGLLADTGAAVTGLDLCEAMLARMAGVHFRRGLRPGPLAERLHAAGFTAVETGSIARIRRAQRRAAPFPRSVTVGVYRDFWISATKSAA